MILSSREKTASGFKKSSAFFTLLAFSITQLGVSPASAAPIDLALQDIRYPETISAFDLQIPANLGKIEERHQGQGDSVLILIQDAHAIPDAQRNIARVIEYLGNQYGIDDVALEGASSAMDARIFHSFPEKKRLLKTMEAYFSAGELSGGTAAAMLDQNRMKFFGIEDWTLYEEGLRLYLEAMKQEPQLSEALSVKREALSKEKEKIYSREMLKVDQTIEAFNQGKKNLIEILGALTPYVRLSPKTELGIIWERAQHGSVQSGEVIVEIKKIAAQIYKILRGETGAGPKVPGYSTLIQKTEIQSDLKILNEKTQAFKTSRLEPEGYALYLKDLVRKYELPIRASNALRTHVGKEQRIKDVKGTRLMNDLEEYADHVMDSLSVKRQAVSDKPEIKTLLERTKELRMLGKLIKLELNRKEWSEISGKRQALSGNEILNAYRLSLTAHMKFYENAEAREQAFLKTIDHRPETIDNPQSQKDHGLSSMVSSLILVAGGFHTEGMIEQAKKHHWSYAVILPKMGRIPEETSYRDQMRGDVSWKDYFRVENGRVKLYDAFVRGMRDRLLGVGANPRVRPLNEGQTRGSAPTLKQWRDQIILDLARERQTAKAGSYTRFLDEMIEGNEPAPEADWTEKWLENVEHFISGLQQLQASGQVTEGNVAQLFQTSKIPSTVNAVLGSGNETVDARLVIPVRFEKQTRFNASVKPAAGQKGRLAGRKPTARVRSETRQTGVEKTLNANEKVSVYSANGSAVLVRIKDPKNPANVLEIEPTRLAYSVPGREGPDTKPLPRIGIQAVTLNNGFSMQPKETGKNIAHTFSVIYAPGLGPNQEPGIILQNRSGQPLVVEVVGNEPAPRVLPGQQAPVVQQTPVAKPQAAAPALDQATIQRYRDVLIRPSNREGIPLVHIHAALQQSALSYGKKISSDPIVTPSDAAQNYVAQVLAPLLVGKAPDKGRIFLEMAEAIRPKLQENAVENSPFEIEIPEPAPKGSKPLGVGDKIAGGRIIASIPAGARPQLPMQTDERARQIKVEGLLRDAINASLPTDKPITDVAAYLAEHATTREGKNRLFNLLAAYNTIEEQQKHPERQEITPDLMGEAMAKIQAVPLSPQEYISYHTGKILDPRPYHEAPFELSYTNPDQQEMKLNYKIGPGPVEVSLGKNGLTRLILFKGVDGTVYALRTNLKTEEEGKRAERVLDGEPVALKPGENKVARDGLTGRLQINGQFIGNALDIAISRQDYVTLVVRDNGEVFIQDSRSQETSTTKSRRLPVVSVPEAPAGKIRGGEKFLFTLERPVHFSIGSLEFILSKEGDDFFIASKDDPDQKTRLEAGNQNFVTRRGQLIVFGQGTILSRQEEVQVSTAAHIGIEAAESGVAVGVVEGKHSVVFSPHEAVSAMPRRADDVGGRELAAAVSKIFEPFFNGEDLILTAGDRENTLYPQLLKIMEPRLKGNPAAEKIREALADAIFRIAPSKDNSAHMKAMGTVRRFFEQHGVVFYLNGGSTFLIGTIEHYIAIPYKGFGGVIYVRPVLTNQTGSFKAGTHNDVVYAYVGYRKYPKSPRAVLNLFTALHETLHSLDFEGDLVSDPLRGQDEYAPSSIYPIWKAGGGGNLEFAADLFALSLAFRRLVEEGRAGIRPAYRHDIQILIQDKLMRRVKRYPTQKLLAQQTGEMTLRPVQLNEEEGHAVSVYRTMRKVFEHHMGEKMHQENFEDFIRVLQRDFLDSDVIQRSDFDADILNLASGLWTNLQDLYNEHIKKLPSYIQNPEEHVTNRLFAALERLPISDGETPASSGRQSFQSEFPLGPGGFRSEVRGETGQMRRLPALQPVVQTADKETLEKRLGVLETEKGADGKTVGFVASVGRNDIKAIQASGLPQPDILIANLNEPVEIEGFVFQNLFFQAGLEGVSAAYNQARDRLQALEKAPVRDESAILDARAQLDAAIANAKAKGFSEILVKGLWSRKAHIVVSSDAERTRVETMILNFFIVARTEQEFLKTLMDAGYDPQIAKAMAKEFADQCSFTGEGGLFYGLSPNQKRAALKNFVTIDVVNENHSVSYEKTVNGQTYKAHVAFRNGQNKITRDTRQDVVDKSLVGQAYGKEVEWTREQLDLLEEKRKASEAGVFDRLALGTADPASFSGKQDFTNLIFFFNGKYILIDPSPRTIANLKKNGLMQYVDTIYLSHVHFDHAGGIIHMLYDHLKNGAEPGQEKIKLVAAASVYDQMKTLMGAMTEGLLAKAGKKDVEEAFNEMFDRQKATIQGDHEIYDVMGLTITTKRTFGHPLPTFGFRIKTPQGTLAYHVDSTMPKPGTARYQEMIDFFGNPKEVDEIIAENGLPGVHITPEQLFAAFPEHVKAGAIFTVHSSRPQMQAGLQRLEIFKTFPFKKLQSRLGLVRKIAALFQKIGAITRGVPLTERFQKDNPLTLGELLAGVGTVKKIQAGEALLTEGQAVSERPFVYVILGGSARREISFLDAGKLSNLSDPENLIQAGALVGEIAAFERGIPESGLAVLGPELRHQLKQMTDERSVRNAATGETQTYFVWKHTTTPQSIQGLEELTKEAKGQLTLLYQNSGNIPRTATITAHTPLTVLEIPIPEFQKIMANSDPERYRKMQQSIEAQFENERRFAETAFIPSETGQIAVRELPEIERPQAEREAQFTASIQVAEEELAENSLRAHEKGMREDAAALSQAGEGELSEVFSRLAQNRMKESLARVSRNKATESLGEDRETYMKKTIRTLAEDLGQVLALPGLEKKREAAVLFMNIFHLLVMQDEADVRLPYAPHSMKHSGNVRNDVKAVHDASTGVRKALQSAYGNAGQSLALISAWLHDVGYGILDPAMDQANQLAKQHGLERYKAGKGYHTRLGLSLLNTEVPSGIDQNATVFDQLDAVFGLSQMTGNARGSRSARMDVEMMVASHGADKGLVKADGLPGTGQHAYRPASLEEDILNFVVRLADNLDADAHNRLYAYHNNPFFLALLRNMAENGEPESVEKIKAHFHDEKNQRVYKAAYAVYLELNRGMDPKTARSTAEAHFKMVLANLEKFDESNFPHFAGMILNHRISEENGELVITVELNQGNGLIPPEVLRYQKERMEMAFNSLRFGGRTIQIRETKSALKEDGTPIIDTQQLRYMALLENASRPQPGTQFASAGEEQADQEQRFLVRELVKFIQRHPELSRRITQEQAVLSDQPVIAEGETTIFQGETTIMRKDQTLPGRQAKKVYVLIQGSGRVLRQGKEVAALGPGDIFGEKALITGRRTADVTVSNEASWLVIPGSIFRRLLSDPQFLVAYGELVASRTSETDLKGGTDQVESSPQPADEVKSREAASVSDTEPLQDASENRDRQALIQSILGTHRSFSVRASTDFSERTSRNSFPAILQPGQSISFGFPEREGGAVRFRLDGEPVTLVMDSSMNAGLFDAQGVLIEAVQDARRTSFSFRGRTFGLSALAGHIFIENPEKNRKSLEINYASLSVEDADYAFHSTVIGDYLVNQSITPYMGLKSFEEMGVSGKMQNFDARLKETWEKTLSTMKILAALFDAGPDADTSKMSVLGRNEFYHPSFTTKPNTNVTVRELPLGYWQSSRYIREFMKFLKEVAIPVWQMGLSAKQAQDLFKALGQGLDREHFEKEIFDRMTSYRETNANLIEEANKPLARSETRGALGILAKTGLKLAVKYSLYALGIWLTTPAAGLALAMASLKFVVLFDLVIEGWSRRPFMDRTLSFDKVGIAGSLAKYTYAYAAFGGLNAAIIFDIDFAEFLLERMGVRVDVIGTAHDQLNQLRDRTKPPVFEGIPLLQALKRGKDKTSRSEVRKEIPTYRSELKEGLMDKISVQIDLIPLHLRKLIGKAKAWIHDQQPLPGDDQQRVIRALKGRNMNPYDLLGPNHQKQIKDVLRLSAPTLLQWLEQYEMISLGLELYRQGVKGDLTKSRAGREIENRPYEDALLKLQNEIFEWGKQHDGVQAHGTLRLSTLLNIALDGQLRDRKHMGVLVKGDPASTAGSHGDFFAIMKETPEGNFIVDGLLVPDFADKEAAIHTLNRMSSERPDLLNPEKAQAIIQALDTYQEFLTQHARSETRLTIESIDQRISQLESRIKEIGVKALPLFGFRGQAPRDNGTFFFFVPRNGNPLNSFSMPTEEYLERLKGTILYAMNYSEYDLAKGNLPLIHLLTRDGKFDLSAWNEKSATSKLSVFDPEKNRYAQFRYFSWEGTFSPADVPEKAKHEITLSADESSFIRQQGTSLAKPQVGLIAEMVEKQRMFKILYSKALEEMIRIKDSSTGRISRSETRVNQKDTAVIRKFSADVVRLFEKGLDDIDFAEAVGVHGTSIEAIQALLKTGKLPNAGRHPGEFYFVPLHQTGLDEKAVTNEARTYTEWNAKKHYVGSKIAEKTSVKMNDEEYEDFSNYVESHQDFASGEFPYFEKFCQVNGISENDLKQWIREIQKQKRKGVLLLISVKAMKSGELTKVSNLEWVLKVPNGLSIQDLLGIEPEGQFEYGELEALQSRLQKGIKEGKASAKRSEVRDVQRLIDLYGSSKSTDVKTVETFVTIDQLFRIIEQKYMELQASGITPDPDEFSDLIFPLDVIYTSFHDRVFKAVYGETSLRSDGSSIDRTKVEPLTDLFRNASNRISISVSQPAVLSQSIQFYRQILNDALTIARVEGLEGLLKYRSNKTSGYDMMRFNADHTAKDSRAAAANPLAESLEAFGQFAVQAGVRFQAAAYRVTTLLASLMAALFSFLGVSTRGQIHVPSEQGAPAVQPPSESVFRSETRTQDQRAVEVRETAAVGRVTDQVEAVLAGPSWEELRGSLINANDTAEKAVSKVLDAARIIGDESLRAALTGFVEAAAGQLQIEKPSGVGLLIQSVLGKVPAKDGREIVKEKLAALNRELLRYGHFVLAQFKYEDKVWGKKSGAWAADMTVYKTVPSKDLAETIADVGLLPVPVIVGRRPEAPQVLYGNSNLPAFFISADGQVFIDQDSIESEYRWILRALGHLQEGVVHVDFSKDPTAPADLQRHDYDIGKHEERMDKMFGGVPSKSNEEPKGYAKYFGVPVTAGAARRILSGIVSRRIVHGLALQKLDGQKIEPITDEEAGYLAQIALAPELDYPVDFVIQDLHERGQTALLARLNAEIAAASPDQASVNMKALTQNQDRAHLAPLARERWRQIFGNTDLLDQIQKEVDKAKKAAQKSHPVEPEQKMLPEAGTSETAPASVVESVAAPVEVVTEALPENLKPVSGAVVEKAGNAIAGELIPLNAPKDVRSEIRQRLDVSMDQETVVRVTVELGGNPEAMDRLVAQIRSAAEQWIQDYRAQYPALQQEAARKNQTLLNPQAVEDAIRKWLEALKDVHFEEKFTVGLQINAGDDANALQAVGRAAGREAAFLERVVITGTESDSIRQVAGILKEANIFHTLVRSLDPKKLSLLDQEGLAVVTKSAGVASESPRVTGVGIRQTENVNDPQVLFPEAVLQLTVALMVTQAAKNGGAELSAERLQEELTRKLFEEHEGQIIHVSKSARGQFSITISREGLIGYIMSLAEAAETAGKAA